jgi:hypothetical protein
MSIINEKLKMIDELQKENISLRGRVLDLETKINPAKMLAEIEDRTQRAKNVIIYNLEESKAVDIAVRIEDDRALVARKLNEIDNSITDGDFKCIRLGKPMDRPRALKVFFKSPERALHIIKNRRNCNGLRLQADLTLMQRDELNAIRDELSRRKNCGEDSLYIRYINGRPKIAKNGASKNLASIIRMPGELRPRLNHSDSVV